MGAEWKVERVHLVLPLVFIVNQCDRATRECKKIFCLFIVKA